MKRSERMGGPHTAKGLGEDCRSTVLVGEGNLGFIQKHRGEGSGASRQRDQLEEPQTDGSLGVSARAHHIHLTGSPTVPSDGGA